MARTRIIAVLAWALCVCAGVLSASAAAQRYPVWWAPEIGIASLDEIDALLAKPFAEEHRHWLYKFEYRGRWESPFVDQQPIDDCLSLFERLAAGYESGVEDRDELLAYRRTYPRCYALLALKRAKPVRVSYVRDFVMDANTLDYMPAMLGYWWCSPRSYPQVVRANRDGVPWNRFDFGYESGWGYRVGVVKNRNVFVLQTWAEDHGRRYDEIFEIIGRGDFNDDGLDDLLVRVTVADHPPEDVISELFLLSRVHTDSVLRVAAILSPLDNERNRCAPGPDELWRRR